jgi:hypothetical protein
MFCSHLTMRGAPARAIQELAGHQDLGTTQRYMHLSPAALDAAIRLLDGAQGRGGIVERRENRARTPGSIEENGGSAGSCTRVRKNIPVRIDDVKKRENARHQPRKISLSVSEAPVRASLPTTLILTGKAGQGGLSHPS